MKKNTTFASPPYNEIYTALSRGRSLDKIHFDCTKRGEREEPKNPKKVPNKKWDLSWRK